MNRKSSFFSFFSLLAWVLPIFTITGDDAPGSPAPTADPTPEPEPTPAPAEPAASADTRSAATKFLDALKSKDTHAAANATLKTQLADANKRLAQLTADNNALTGAVEASQELLTRLGSVETALGLKSGTLSTGSAADINTAIAGKISSGLIDEAAKAGVEVAALPKAAAADVDPKIAATNALTGRDRAQHAFAQMPIFKQSA